MSRQAKLLAYAPQNNDGSEWESIDVYEATAPDEGKGTTQFSDDERQDTILRRKYPQSIPLKNEPVLGGSKYDNERKSVFSEPAMKRLNIYEDARGAMGRGHAVATWYIVAATIVALTAFTLSALTYENSLRNRDILENQLPKLTQAEHMATAAQLIARVGQIHFIQLQDQMCFMIALQCAGIQDSFQSSGRGAGQLLKVCAEMELNCAGVLSQELTNSDFSRHVAGNCYSLLEEDSTDFLLCLTQQNLRKPSVEATGLLPQRVQPGGISNSVPYSSTFSGSQIPTFEAPPNLFGRYYYSNPQMGPMYLNLEKTLLEKDLYGVFISYTYATEWNKNTIELSLGFGSSILPQDLLPFDGVAYVNLNTESSTKVDGSPGSFGKITTVLEGTSFEGTGELYIDDEIIVLSGPTDVNAWDIGGGLSSAVARPTILQSLLASATNLNDESFISPSKVHTYIDHDTGKRYFVVGMRDKVDSTDLSDSLCLDNNTFPFLCGTIIKIDRDALWASGPPILLEAAITRFTTANVQGPIDTVDWETTPGEFIVLMERNLIISAMHISRLLTEESACHIRDYMFFIPSQSSGLRFPVISFYRYDNGERLFGVPSMWQFSGDILSYVSFSDGAAITITPCTTHDCITNQNILNDVNLHVSQEWKDITGLFPTLITKASEASAGVPLYYGIDFFTGGIFALGTFDVFGLNRFVNDPPPVRTPWSLVYVAWLPYIVSGIEHDRPPVSEAFGPNGTGTDSTFLDTMFLPYPMDIKITTDGRFIFVAAYGVGQVIVYHRERQDDVRIKFCGAAQVTTGQFNQSSAPPVSHPARPGVPLHGGPSKLAIDPSNRFLYVTTGSKFDDCIYPSTGPHGSVVVRYAINSFACGPQTLVLDPAFFVSSFDLPGNIVSDVGDTAAAIAARGLPARFGEITFATGDGSNLMNTNK